MPAFIVATIRITDPEKFKGYTDAIAGLSDQFGGEGVVKAQIKDVMEGDAPAGERVVVVKFPDEASARAYLSDPRYLEGKAKRDGAADVVMRLVVV